MPNIPQQELDEWRAALERARTDACERGKLVAGGRRREAIELKNRLRDCAISLANRMEYWGANRPKSLPQADLDEVPLAHLSSAANRRLHACLVEALAAAREVDSERGFDDSSGLIEMLASRTAFEINGPPGFGRE